MKLGIALLTGGSDLDTLLEQVRTAREAGFDSAFFNQFASLDAISVAALAGRLNPGMEVGTAVAHIYARHPYALAEQALAANAISGGTFTLGIGPSHKHMVEDLYGVPYERPAAHVRDYLTALRPLLRGEPVDHRGETLSVKGRLTPPGAVAPPVLLSALGPVMLRIAGELADGTMTTWTGAPFIADYIAPRITAAAEAAGRPAPRIVTSVMVCVTSDPDRVRGELQAQMGFTGDFAAYRAVLDRQGLSGVHELLVAGDESAVEKEIARFEAAGVTDLVISPLGSAEEQARTFAYFGR
ncbi:TIGR03564 family F420-dependent LLM class oxidoreductase [Nonomuraea sp. NPDC049309]|uniref:TIGR03564 family F420-dependent LLM class oxidoreductase n=1 Tax=Nonomuraea sp. NPDC049309 TaxID=3364350 RepID=UPI003712181E